MCPPPGRRIDRDLICAPIPGAVRRVRTPGSDCRPGSSKSLPCSEVAAGVAADRIVQRYCRSTARAAGRCCLGDDADSGDIGQQALRIGARPAAEAALLLVLASMRQPPRSSRRAGIEACCDRASVRSERSPAHRLVIALAARWPRCNSRRRSAATAYSGSPSHPSESAVARPVLG